MKAAWWKWMVGILLPVLGVLLMGWASAIERRVEAAQILPERVRAVEVRQALADKQLDEILSELRDLRREQHEMYRLLTERLDNTR